MKKLYVCLLSVLVASLGIAQDVSFGVVFKRDVAIPVVRKEVWRDEGLQLFRGVPSFDVLLGYDARPSQERVTLGYQLSLGWQLSQATRFHVGVALLSPVQELSFRDVVERAGVSLGVTVALR